MREMSALKEQAIELLDILLDDRVEIIIKVMQGFITPVILIVRELAWRKENLLFRTI
jgi:hypothetical protein